MAVQERGLESLPGRDSGSAGACVPSSLSPGGLGRCWGRGDSQDSSLAPGKERREGGGGGGERHPEEAQEEEENERRRAETGCR